MKFLKELSLMKKSIILVSVLVLASMTFMACSKSGSDSAVEGTKSETKKVQVNIATASIGGAYYAVGQEISNLVNGHSDLVSMSPEVTAGSVENPRLIGSGDADFGMTNANLAFAAYNGESPYSKLDVLAVGNLHPSVFHIITLASSDIDGLADLKGKKIAVGPAGGGTLPILTLLLEQVGLSIDDITPSYLSYSDGFTQLSDGNVDVALALSGYPASSVMEIAATKKIRFVNIDPAILANVSETYKYYSSINVPSSDYKLDADATALGINNVLLVRADLDEQTVYEVTKAIYENLEEFAQNNATAKQINADTISETIIPLHAGAQEFYAER
jgi:TRAP transporter TAXI family solute receptor